MYSDNLVMFAQAMIAECAQRRIAVPTMAQMGRLLKMFQGDADAAADALMQTQASIAIGQVMRARAYPPRTGSRNRTRTARTSSTRRSSRRR